MIIYTSNFSKAKDIQHYSIAASKPDWDNSIRTIKELAPKWELVQQWNNVKSLEDSDSRKRAVVSIYTNEYLNYLEDLGIKKVLSSLKDKMVLCCWCKSTAFCHRHLLAEFLRSYGVEVKEI